MTVTHREGGEVPVIIQIFFPFQCIDDNRAVRLLEIDHHVESVHEDVFFQDRKTSSAGISTLGMSRSSGDEFVTQEQQVL